ncbi:MAG: hypothetical protein WAL88_07555 [Nitrosotalea sp.]
MNTILVLGRYDDPHIKGISNELSKLGKEHIVIDHFDTSDSFHVMFNDGIKNSVININKRQISNHEIKSIWNTSALKIMIDEKIIDDAKKFVQAEWTEGITSLWDALDVKWVNHPSSISNAVNRMKQLQLANEVGLKTPKTLVTNDSQAFLNFFNKYHGEIVAKTLHSSEGVPEGKMIFTTKVTENDLKNASSLKYAPCMFQEYIPKKTEFRITVVGETIRTAEIHSQKSKKTMHDWRHYDDFTKTPYVEVDLPDDISHKLLKLTKKMNLEFGAADLIRTPDDDFIFLEINPNGRWWWIQELTGMNIAKDIANHLAN